MIGAGTDVIGQITSSDTIYTSWYVTNDNRYIAARLVSTEECLPQQISLPESCIELQSVANDLNPIILSEFDEISLCEYLQDISDSFWSLPFISSNNRIIEAQEFAID